MTSGRGLPPAEVLLAVVEAIDQGVVAADASGVVRYVNAAAEDMLRTKPRHLDDISRMTTPSDPSEGSATANDLIQRARNSGQRVAAPAKLRRADGSEIEITGELVPVMQDGRTAAGVAVFRDVTEQNRALQGLAQALTQAEHSVERKTQFLANMSHEIRTPMNGVIGMMELLSATDLTSEQHQFIDIAKASCEALLDILNEILDFSKLETGNVELELEPFEAAGVAEDVAGLLTRAAEDKGVQMHVHVGSGVPQTVIGDGGRVRQVLMNLVSNAVDFTDRGSVNLSVERTVPLALGAPPVALRYTVTDTGCGIASERLGDLFKPFSREPAVGRSMPTTGLGLAVSHQLIRLMGGELRCESEIGVGSMFSFVIPVQETSQPSRLIRPLPEGASVVVVVDDPVNRRIVREYCQRLGAQVSELSTADEVEAAVADLRSRAESFDVVVCDVEAASGGSVDVMARIRSDKAVSATPVLALGSVSQDDQTRKELMRLADAVVLKPVRHARFASALSELYWSRRDRAATPAPADGEPALGHSVVTDSTALAGAVTFVEPYGVAKPTPTEADPISDDRVRVLVAEDDPTNQIVIDAFLDRLGLAATVVADGRAALAEAERGAYALVLMDCQMPEMDGYEATRALRRLGGRFASLPVVAMTANAMEGDEQRCLDAGMDGYLAKPLAIDRLREVLGERLPDLALPKLESPTG